jgi:hypothetical protein
MQSKGIQETCRLQWESHAKRMVVVWEDRERIGAVNPLGVQSIMFSQGL